MIKSIDHYNVKDTDTLICLSASATWYGRAIRWLTGSNVNHAFIAYKSQDWGSWWAVQVDERGVIKIPTERVKLNYIECYRLKGDILIDTSKKKVRSMIGRRYDWLGILGFLIKLIAWRLLGRRIINPIHKKGELFCSEFVVNYLQQAEGVSSNIADLEASNIAPGGNRVGLGSVSLQSVMKIEAERVVCPFPLYKGQILR